MGSVPSLRGLLLKQQPLVRLLDLPGGLVVDDIGWAAADRVVKFHHSVGNRSRDTFIFPRTTHQVVVFVVEGREYVVTIFVGFNAAPVEVKCLSQQALVPRQRTDMSWNGPSPLTFRVIPVMSTMAPVSAPLSIFATVLST